MSRVLGEQALVNQVLLAGANWFLILLKSKFRLMLTLESGVASSPYELGSKQRPWPLSGSHQSQCILGTRPGFHWLDTAFHSTAIPPYMEAWVSSAGIFWAASTQTTHPVSMVPTTDQLQVPIPVTLRIRCPPIHMHLV